MKDEELKQYILDVASDAIGEFMYYSRKDDYDLPRGAIEKAVARGLISYDEIADHMRNLLNKHDK